MILQINYVFVNIIILFVKIQNLCYNVSMIESLKETSLYNSLNLTKTLHHAYLFTSIDKELNNSIAMLFAKSLICENNNICNTCFGCKQFDINSHPDFIMLNQDAIKVDDVNKIINQLSTKPISNNVKVFLILNAENINEISQNKLLKSLEEPNASNIFILTTTKIDKLLPTVLSRLHKVHLTKINHNDKLIISNELKSKNLDVGKFINSDISLTEFISYETNEETKKTLKAIKFIFENLKSSQDIPKVSSALPDFEKNLFYPLLQKLFISYINDENYFDEDLLNLINQNFSKKVIIKCLPLIEESYKKVMSNVNFGYVLDNLLFNILKEKFYASNRT